MPDNGKVKGGCLTRRNDCFVLHCSKVRDPFKFQQVQKAPFLELSRMHQYINNVKKNPKILWMHAQVGRFLKQHYSRTHLFQMLDRFLALAL